MNNRWGRPIQTKANLRGSGQSNINININFNALKEKPSMFGGKKIDNFIQVSNEPKSNISRPNVSMETLKHKKKPVLNKEDQYIQQGLNRKKSKSRINNEICTPQKIRRNKDLDNSKSVGRKSTQKRGSKSFENLKTFYRRSSPRYSNQQQVESSQEKSRTNSRSRSKSQSQKKLNKNKSKPNINTNSTTRTKNTTHNSKKQEDKPIPTKRKKPQAVQKIDEPIQHPQIPKKPSLTKIKPKPKSDNKKPSKLPSSKPSYSEEVQPDNNFQQQSLDDNKKKKRLQKQKQQAQLYSKIVMIQKNIRASKGRSQFINHINVINHEIEEKKYYIISQHPKFWDDAESDSIIQADDQEIKEESEYQRNQGFKKQSSCKQKDSVLSNQQDQQVSGISKSETFELNQKKMMEMISKLEDNLKKQQAKTEELQQQNKQLKVSLQKVKVQSGFNSNENFISSRFKSSRFSPKEAHEADPFLQEQQLDNNNSNKKSSQSLQQKEVGKGFSIQHIVISEQQYQQYGFQKLEDDWISPRSMYVNINKDLMRILRKKQYKLEQNFKKEIQILNNRIFSPRTHSNKLNELNRIFERQKDKYKNKLNKVSQEIKEITLNQRSGVLDLQPKEEESDKQKKQWPKHKKMEEIDNINLNSHRSRSSSEENEAMQSSQEIQNNFIHKNNKDQLNEEIQSRNKEVIRIFDEIQRQHENEQGHPQEEVQRQNAYSQSNPEDDSNFEQVGINRENAGPKGLQTALLFIKEYCMSLIEFIRNSEVHKTTFIQNICTPIVYDSYQFLKSYRTTLEDSNEASYCSLEKQYIYPFFKLIYSKTQVITRQAFNDFNEVYEKFQGQCHFPIERQFFLNSILDAFNQSLDFKRPCSIYGQSPAWISQSRTLKNFDLLNQNMDSLQNFSHSQKFDQICGISIARVIEWSTCLCGFIPQSPEIQNVVVDEEQINHIRQTRIALMLQKDLLEGQEAMIDFGMEQTEVRIQLGVLLVQFLVSECLTEFQQFRK